MICPLFTLLTAEPGPTSRPADGDPRPRGLAGVAGQRHERDIVGGNEDDALGALTGCPRAADLIQAPAEGVPSLARRAS
jgi:hypothetical protein